jgi:tRNA(fMet)-specific endonuclease VapC
MNYILDTNVCIHILNNRDLGILKHAKSKSRTAIYISSITEAELWYGVFKSTRPNENSVNLKSFLELFPKLPFTSEAAKNYGELKLRQQKAGRILGPNDLLIASQALELEATLVTINEKEFKQVKELKIENWVSKT